MRRDRRRRTTNWWFRRRRGWVSPTDNSLYYNRNRFYNPHLGRFMQRDPNETALPIMTALSYAADPMATLLGGFSLTGLYGDGMNLYAYEGGNPVSDSDALGLYDDFDPFTEVDDIMMAIQMDKVAWAEYAYEGGMGFALGALRAGATIALTSALTALCPPLGIAVGAAMSGYSAYTTVRDIMDYGWSWGRGVSLALDGINAGQSARALRAMRMANANLNRARAAYVERGGAAVRGGAFGIIDWKGYPAGVPKPAGPFHLVHDAQYAAARAAANNANRALHRAHPEWKGLEIHEVHPVKFGGSPTDPANKIVLDSVTHDHVSAFWARVQANTSANR